MVATVGLFFPLIFFAAQSTRSSHIRERDSPEAKSNRSLPCTPRQGLPEWLAVSEEASTQNENSRTQVQMSHSIARTDPCNHDVMLSGPCCFDLLRSLALYPYYIICMWFGIFTWFFSCLKVFVQEHLL